MIFYNDSRDPALGLFCAQMLAILESGRDLERIGVEVARVSNQTTSQRTFGSGATIPTSHVVDAADFSVFFIGGTDNIVQATNLVSAWTLRFPPGELPGCPPFFEEAANLCNNRASGVGRTPRQRYYWVGHSLGGSIAHASASAFIRSRPNHSVLSISFGAPRTGHRAFGTRLSAYSNVRYMNDTDPVPTLPPQVPEAIPYASSLGVEALQRWSNYEHIRGGCVLSASGSVTGDVLPPQPVLENGASIVDWLWKAATDTASTHNIGEYVRRLQFLVDAQSQAAPVPVPVSVPETSEVPTRRQANTAIEAYQQAIVQAGVGQNNVGLVQPKQQGFTTAKLDRLWWVVFGGQLVACGHTNKRAAKMARLGNQFLRQLQRMSAVDVSGLQSLLPEYLDAASQADNGFVPPIAVFPQ